MTFLSVFLGFDPLAVLHVSGIRNSNFVLFYCQCTDQGETEKSSGQYFGLIVMSNRLALF
jgi:hypothetical protein